MDRSSRFKAFCLVAANPLQGIVDAPKTQEQDPGVRFTGRLSLLVDQQWNWRENQALARRLKSAKLRHDACIEDIDYRAARGLEKTVIRGLAKDSQSEPLTPSSFAVAGRR